MQEFDIVCVGDAILDIFLNINNESEFCTFDKATNHLILLSGEKILVDEVSFMLGGNACNVSVGTKRLGLQSALVAEFGGDVFAEKLQSGLKREGVNLDFTKTTLDTVSTFSAGLHVAGERTLFIHHVVRKHEMGLDGIKTKWIYLTSMGREWENIYHRVLEHVKQSGTKLAFNPGSQQLKDGVGKFTDIILATDMLMVNLDEAELILYGKVKSPQEREPREDVLSRLQQMGAKEVCMTDGENGSIALDSSGKFYTCGIVKPTSFTGRTGVGDGFASGFLSARIYGKTTEEALKWGAVNASGVLEHIGAQTGLLGKDQLEKRVGENF